jgi:hypothetical protein
MVPSAVEAILMKIHQLLLVEMVEVVRRSENFLPAGSSFHQLAFLLRLPFLPLITWLQELRRRVAHSNYRHLAQRRNAARLASNLELRQFSSINLFYLSISTYQTSH